jgi:hypothetical protein
MWCAPARCQERPNGDLGDPGDHGVLEARAGNRVLEARVAALQGSVAALAKRVNETSATAVRLSAVTGLNVGLLACILVLAMQASG